MQGTHAKVSPIMLSYLRQYSTKVTSRFFYNAATGECEEFVFGGCGGNDNKFDTKEKCQEVRLVRGKLANKYMSHRCVL